jgi:hypothetical protein
VSRVFSKVIRRSAVAPPGRGPGPARFDHPPDGWMPVDPTWVVKVGVRVDRSLLAAGDLARREITRRKFISWVSKLGLVIGTATTGVVWAPGPAHALACNVFDQNNQNAGPCGPSPRCNAVACQSANCRVSRSDTEKRAHNQSGCCSSTCSGTQNCWTENCCDRAANAEVRCCDCCGPGGSTSCSGANCPGTQCICEITLRTC